MSKDYLFEPRPIFSSYTPNLLLGSYYIEDGFQADPTMWNDGLEDAFVNNAGMKEGQIDTTTYLNDFSAETILMGTKKLDELGVIPQSYFWKWVNYDGQVQIPTEMSEDDFESPAYERFMEDAVGYDSDNPYFLLVVDTFMDDGEDVDIWAEEADWNRIQTTARWWEIYDQWMENEGVDFLTTLAEENYDWAVSNAYELGQIGYEIPAPDDDDYYWSMRQAESFAANDPWSYRGLLLKPANHVGRSKICDAKGCSKVKKHSRKSWGIPYHFCDRHQEEIDDTYSAENESHWMTFGRVDYNWATDPDDLELTDEDFWVIDEHIRNEVRYEIDTNNLPGESNISSWTLSLTEEDEDDFTIYYYWGPAQTTGVNSAESFEAPYTGAGSLMGISGDTDLSSFTNKELTESSAIHGDFDTASLDYSGHQNIEVRAESFGGSFVVNNNRGFSIGFDNGYALSVKFGPATYSDNYDMEIYGNVAKARDASTTHIESSTAEIAVLKDGTLMSFDEENPSNQIMGWVPTSLIPSLLTAVSEGDESKIRSIADSQYLRGEGDETYSYGSESFAAPYTGPGATMNIGQDTDLSSFTPDELTKSSAIHGDFDTASLDYSGHQNIEVRAEGVWDDSDYYDPQDAWERIFENWMEEWVTGGATRTDILRIYAAKNGIVGSQVDEVDVADATAWYEGLTIGEREDEIFTTTGEDPFLHGAALGNVLDEIIADEMDSWDDQFQ